MFTLGINFNHNSSVCVFKNKKLIYYNQEDRLSKIRKQTGIPFYCLQDVKKKFSVINNVVTTGYDYTGCELIKSYLDYIKINYKTFFHYYKSHHLIHSILSFFNSGFNEAIVFVVDGRGSFYNLNDGSLGYETTSIYKIKKPLEIKCIYKKIFTYSEKATNVNFNYEIPNIEKINPFGIDENTKFELTNQHDLGHFYSLISDHLQFTSEEGKLMGLSAYGKFNEKIFKDINSKDFTKKEKINLEKYNYLKIDKNNKNNLKDLAYHTQLKFENDYESLIKKYTSKENIILTGGTALNVVNNEKIRNKFANKLYVEPLCGDEGNSIGACQYYLHNNYKFTFKPLKNLYLNPKPTYNFNLPKNLMMKNVVLDDVVNLLEKGEIVALFQGGAEAGPRALGNRSLLIDPRVFNAKKIMNKIKFRETFRPFAGVVLQKFCKDYFNIDVSKDMMYAVKCKNNKDIKSIIHLDQTCRIQTVNKQQNKTLYNILKSFHKKTNMPILMNTSFNIKGNPIVETAQDAIDVLSKCNLKYLYFSDINKLVSKEHII